MPKEKAIKKKIKKKIYHSVFRVEGSYNTIMDFGWVENPTFNNEFYIDVVSKHKSGTHNWELRLDESLIFIKGLASAINKKLTGLDLIKKEEYTPPKRSKKEIK